MLPQIADILRNIHFAQGIVPAADRFTTGISSDIISLKKYGAVGFLIIQGAIEDAGVSNLVKVQACDDTTPSNTVDMPFYRASQRWSTTNDLWAAAMALNASTGYNFNTNHAVANCLHLAVVTAEMVEAAAPGYEFARLNIAETVDKTVTAAVLAIGLYPRYPEAIPHTMIS